MVNFFLPFIFNLVFSREFSVSGVSSGAFMSVQMGVAYSSQIPGIGAIAGGPYYCALGSLIEALTACAANPELLNPESYETYALERSEDGEIDNLSNMASQKAWIYSGILDSIVQRGVVEALENFYKKHNVEVTSRYDVLSQHAWITVEEGNPCYHLGSPYINHCEIDAAGEILGTIYDPSTLGIKNQVVENMFAFDESPYYSNEGAGGLDSEGFIYWPTHCNVTDSSSSCRVHIAYHGCKMGKDVIDDIFFRESGLNEWGEGSNIIVIYPEIVKSRLDNPDGCWDWWGYTNEKYALKEGMQMASTYEMAENLPTRLFPISGEKFK